MKTRFALLALFLLAAGAAQVRDSLHPDFAAKLRVVVRRADTGEVVPARVYLFKNGRPFRLSPVDAHLPLRPDLFYRERLWRRVDPPKTLEVTARDQSHFILLEGEATFDLPAATDYRLEAYRGFSFKPAAAEFSLAAEQERTVELRVEPVSVDMQEDWLAADDHIHLMRAPEDDAVFLDWLRAEDLAVGNFLELQRQQHAAVQYAFGEGGEAKADGFSIRSGHESRSRFYGHVLLLGGDRMVRPLSIGVEYANSPEAYPYPFELFRRGREVGALNGFAHFYGSQPSSSLLMDLVRGGLDFIELFQFGVLHTREWYDLLNAGFRVVGLAGSDFPANVGRYEEWPRAFPLLGPERAMVRAEAGASAYEAWAAGVREGAVTVTNGPLLEFAANGRTSGATVEWTGASRTVRGSARAAFHRPITALEIVVNGEVVESTADGGGEAKLDFEIELDESAWIAARARAQSHEGEPEIQAHANPIYFLKDGAPVYRPAARRALAERWSAEASYYRTADLTFADPVQRQALLDAVAETEMRLSAPPGR